MKPKPLIELTTHNLLMAAATLNSMRVMLREEGNRSDAQDCLDAQVLVADFTKREPKRRLRALMPLGVKTP